MILEKRIYNNAELAEWFGIKESTFRSKKRQKLKELKEYADFVEVKSKIEIKQVYEKMYVRKTSPSFRRVASLVEETWSKNGFDTCKNVSEKIKTDSQLQKLQPSSIYEYTRKAHIINYGSPAKQNGGVKGMCKYQWGKRDKDCYTQPLPFTKEESDYFYSLIKETFRADPQETARRQALRQAMKRKEISKEEYFELIDAMEEEQEYKWVLIEQGMYNKFGIELIRGTQEEPLVFRTEK